MIKTSIPTFLLIPAISDSTLTERLKTLSPPDNVSGYKAP